MLLDMSILDILGAIFVFLVGFALTKIIARVFLTSLSRVIFLYVWHTLFCFLYVWYVSTYGGDSYYISSLKDHIVFLFGTQAVLYLTMFFSKILGFSFLATSLVYNIFGFIGLVAFDAALRYAVEQKGKNIRQLATIIILLPSVSFWSSGIGKDSLAFLSGSLVLWSSINFKKRVWVIVPAIIIMLFVRPHIAGVMILSFAVSIIIQNKISPIFRVGISAIAIIASIILVPIGIKYSQLDNFVSTKQIEKYIHNRSLLNIGTSGSIDISKMPVPLQIGTYLFRPLPFEAHNIASFFASLDNMILIYLFILGIKSMLQTKKYKNKGENRLFMWTYSIVTLLMLSTTTANLGISVRQKWMFTPILIFLIMSIIRIRNLNK